MTSTPRTRSVPGRAEHPNHTMVRAEGTRDCHRRDRRRNGTTRTVTGNERQFDCGHHRHERGFQPSSALLHKREPSSFRDFRSRRGHSRSASGVGTLLPATCLPSTTRAYPPWQGRLAGLEASKAARPLSEQYRPDGPKTFAQGGDIRISAVALSSRCLPPATSPRARDKFVCYCEERLAKDVVQAWTRGSETYRSSSATARSRWGRARGRCATSASRRFSPTRRTPRSRKLGQLHHAHPSNHSPSASWPGPCTCHSSERRFTIVTSRRRPR